MSERRSGSGESQGPVGRNPGVAELLHDRAIPGLPASTRSESVKANGIVKEPKEKKTPITISAPNFKIVEMKIIGTTNFVMQQFPEKARNAMMKKHEAGSTAKKGTTVREKRDFTAEYEASKHMSTDGWVGIPCPAFRNAMISACRTVGFQMTRAKLAFWCLADGVDQADGTGLVQIHGEPEMFIAPTRNETGVADLRSRARWKKWHAVVRIQFDADMFTATDIVNLLARAGIQVGVGEGRNDSKKSNGMGWGAFRVETEADNAEAK